MSLTESPVTSVDAFAVDAQDDAIPQVYRIYTVSTTLPERVETVHVTANYNGEEDDFDDVWVVQLVHQNGLTIAESPAPLLVGKAQFHYEVHLTWGRGLVGQEPATALTRTDLVGTTVWVWSAAALPDVVLAPGAYVNLLVYSINGNEQTPAPVTDGSITTSRDGFSTTSAFADIAPLLSPTDATVV